MLKFNIKTIAVIILIAIFACGFPCGITNVQAREWGSCDDCYRFFALSTPGLYTGCINAMLDCGSWSCMCRIQARLDQKYTREYLAQKELAFFMNLGWGAFMPGAKLLDPDNRALMANPATPFYVKTDLLLGKSIIMLNAAGLRWEAAAELGNALGLSTGVSYAMDSNNAPTDRVLMAMMGAMPYYSDNFGFLANQIDFSMQSRDVLKQLAD